MTNTGEYNANWFESASEADMPRMIDALYRVQKLNAVVRDYQAVLNAIMVESQMIANAEACSLLLYDSHSEELYFSVALGDSSQRNRQLKEVRLRLDQGIAGESARLRKTINVADASNDSRLHKEADNPTGFNTRSLLAVPMVEKEHLIGILEVVNKIGEKGFSTFDERIMEMFALLGASVIVQARLIDENLQAERMAAIGQTVAGLSHYSKNILGSVGASIEIIDEGLETENTEVIKSPWRIMKRSIGRITNIIEDMLAYSKDRKPMLEMCSLAEIIDDAFSSLEAIVLERIFDPFFSTKGSRGTGLGLAVTRKIVEEHGGRIQAKNSGDHGSVFEMRIRSAV